MPGGRPSTYDPVMAEKILALLANGQLLKQICARRGFPKPSCVAMWVVRNVDDFQEKYFAARAAGGILMSEDIIEIVDHVADCDSMARVQAARTRADKRQWLLSRLLPSRFSDRLMITDPMSGGRTVVNIWLPRKGDRESSGRLIEGTPRQVLEDQSDDDSADLISAGTDDRSEE